MSIRLHQIVVPSAQRAFRVLLRLIDKAEAHYLAEGLDPAAIAGLRLAPDMNPLSFQVEAAINNGVGAAARLRSESPPKVEGLTTLSSLRDALRKAIDELERVRPDQLDGAEAREIVLPSPKGARHFEGLDYALSLALPNIHFHTSIAYALLRTAGLEIGKRDFLGDLPPRRAVAPSPLG